MKLSIIIPYYNAENYTKQLLECLDRQMDPEVEVILIDDGSDEPYKADYEWLKIRRKKNGGASTARNKGLDLAQGEYVAFIDADDLVADNYIKTILQKIQEEQFDYCYLSWKTLPGRWSCDVRLKSIEDKFPPFNLCVWNRVYKRDMIGDIRFNTRKKIAEDAEFIRKVKERDRKKAFIGDYMYFYRPDSDFSLTKRFSEGRLDTNRIVYHIPHVTENMQYLVKEFEKADQDSEVILMTNRNDIPELEDYAMIISPCRVKGTELRGEPTRLFEMIEKPIKTQVVIYTAQTFNIGGIETFIYNFCSQMSEYYDILVLYDQINGQQASRLRKLVQIMKNDRKRAIICDTLILNRITDQIPKNVEYKKHIQMVHACKMVKTWRVPDANEIVAVSDVAGRSYPEIKGKYHVISNLTVPKQTGRALFLISATRTSTFEKGQKRMVRFAEVLKENGIKFLWLCFTNEPIKGAAEGMICVDPVLEIGPYIKAADYLVQLSDAEGFCYSIVEALELGTPVITTPVDVLPEIGFEDGVNGYTVPFEMDKQIDLERIIKCDLKGFTYAHDNKSIINKWRKLLGNTKPKHTYKPEEQVSVRALCEYFDIDLQRNVKKREEIVVTEQRAQTLIIAGVGEIV